MAATWIAIRGPEVRRQLAEAAWWWPGIVFPAVVLTSLLFYSHVDAFVGTRARTSRHGAIAVSGEQWWWRVTYSGTAGAAFASANEIRIPVGRDVISR